MEDHLRNHTVKSLSWNRISVVVKPWPSREPQTLLEDVTGRIDAGEMLAITGPSGSGKTTLLNFIAHSSQSAKYRIPETSKVLVNGCTTTRSDFARLARFVECDDPLLGSLTVRETLYFAARLGLGSRVSSSQKDELVSELLGAFGLSAQANSLVGTFGRRGLSTGQKRRLSIATQLISAPKILFLDEPTSGLDSAASFKVMSYVRRIALANNLLVVCSIHQPSSITFEQFDKVLLLSGGKTCYLGEVNQIQGYFAHLGYTIRPYVNLAEFMLELVNVDFEDDKTSALANISAIHEAWRPFTNTHDVQEPPSSSSSRYSRPQSLLRLSRSLHPPSTSSSSAKSVRPGYAVVDKLKSVPILTVLHRTVLKSKRDPLIYPARLLMYTFLAVLIGTIWLRLPARRSSLVPFYHSLLFSSTFMSFTTVVLIPSFLDDLRLYIHERASKLYSPTTFLITTFLVSLPWLILTSLLFSGIAYFLVNYNPTPISFFTFALWIFLNLLASESLVILITALIPNFIGALAAFAMVNAVGMACNGFMVPQRDLPNFWRYLVFEANFQGYAFRGMARNEFGGRAYECDDGGEGCGDIGLMVLRMFGFEGGYAEDVDWDHGGDHCGDKTCWVGCD